MVSGSPNSAGRSKTMSNYSYEFASGYPYIPHNATTQEREACNARMRAINARGVPYNQPVKIGNSDPGAYRPHAQTKTCTDILAGKSPSPEPSADIHSSSEGDSHGPETPHSHDRFFWKDSSDELPKQERPNHPHPRWGRVHSESYKYYPPVPPVVPEEKHTSESVSDKFTTAASSAARKELQQLIYRFNILVLGFKFPSNLEFTTLPNNGELPNLAHTPTNKPLLEHIHKLEKMLEEVDAIESHGDKDIRQMRKQLVDRMLSEQGGLKQMEKMAWYNFKYERGIEA